jgi:hypothetical protein
LHGAGACRLAPCPGRGARIGPVVIFIDVCRVTMNFTKPEMKRLSNSVAMVVGLK